MDRGGRIRSSQPGSHQFARPDRWMMAGTRRVRRRKASRRTAAARPMARAAVMPPAQARAGMTMAQCLVLA